MSSLTTIQVAESGGVCTLTLNRPDSKNALSRQLVAEFSDVIRDIHKRTHEIRVLIISAKGNVFCAGADLKERKDMDQIEVQSFLESLNNLFFQLCELPIPTISVVQGPALGGGCELTLCTDFRIMAEDAFLSLPEVSLGIIPGAGGTQRLPQIIGIARAKWMIFTGERVPAPTALSWGLATEVVPAARIEDASRSLVEKITRNAPLAVQQAKQAVQHSGWSSSAMEGLQFERDCYQLLLKTEDRVEALQAFSEKRPPKFKGR